MNELYVRWLRDDRETAATAYKPPPKQSKWKVYVAVCILPFNGSEKAVLACLIDHANAHTGRCDPSEPTISRKLGIPLRTVERCIAKLIAEGWIARLRRGRKTRGGRASNAYAVAWHRLIAAYDAYKGTSETRPK